VLLDAFLQAVDLKLKSNFNKYYMTQNLTINKTLSCTHKQTYRHTNMTFGINKLQHM